MNELRAEHGWVGCFTRAEADGAWPNGTVVVKINSEDADSHQNGAVGVVLGSMGVPPDMGHRSGRHFYFVEWNDWRAEHLTRGVKRVAVGIVARKLRRKEGR